MQVLEGNEINVRETFNRIARDPRHRGVITLTDQSIEKRQFGDWEMAFREAEALPENKRRAVSQFFNIARDEKVGDKQVSSRKLLSGFARSMR